MRNINTLRLHPSLYSTAKYVMEKYRTDISHCEHVLANAFEIAKLALPEANLAHEPELNPDWQRLGMAALLHDIGHFVADKGHHKHSFYLIQQAEELRHLNTGLVEDVATLSWCHRKHAKRAWLDERFLGNWPLFQLSAILRVADGLDRSHSGRVTVVDGKLQHDEFILEVNGLRKSEYEALMDRKADAWKLAFHQSFDVRILSTI